MKHQSKNTVMTLSNAIEFVTGVVHEVVGQDVGKTINGQKASRAALAQLIASRVSARFAKHTTTKVG